MNESYYPTRFTEPLLFDSQIQNDQCQEMDATTDKWVKLTDNGEWGSHSVSPFLCLSSLTTPFFPFPSPTMYKHSVYENKMHNVVGSFSEKTAFVFLRLTFKFLAYFAVSPFP